MSTVATGPFPLSNDDSITTPVAGPLSSALSSNISACKIIAFICNKFLAICLPISISEIMPQKYKVFINGRIKIITENWEKFCLNYTLIKAAGGVVYNQKKELLMIFRNGKWDLPKGKLETGESIEECAIREVQEECGVNNLQITSKLSDTYHTYELNGKMVLKHTFWFRMKTNFEGELSPQTKEGITKVEWVNQDEIAERLKNAYANLVELFQ